MFNGLRGRLTLLYILVVLLLLGFTGSGMYAMLISYFRSTTDLALQHRMAQEFRLLNIPVPSELVTAEQSWYMNSGGLTVTPISKNTGKKNEDGNDDRETSDDTSSDDLYNADLAPIFVLHLNQHGQLIPSRAAPDPPLPPNQDAFDAARANGNDRRTVTTVDGGKVRLLTYRLAHGGVTEVLQLGRTLVDQDRILKQVLVGLLVLGGISTGLMGVGGWWLAGRAIIPAQQAWERQQVFVANAGHELRAPLTLLRASAEVAQRNLPPDNVDLHSLLKDVLQECDHMGGLIEDLLLLSRLDAGRLQFAHTIVKLSDLVTDVQRKVGRLVDERGIHLCVEGVSGSVWGDATRLRQVLLILLDNALRYTPPGGTIRIESHPHGQHTTINVIDTGLGIAPEHLSRVFERFYRASSVRDEENEGSGLGLSIAKMLIEAQQGHITITSSLGKGTCVSLILPNAT